MLEHELGGFDKGSLGRHQISNNAQKSVSSSFFFPIQPDAKIVASLLGIAELEKKKKKKSPEKSPGKTKTSGADFYFFGGGLSRWRKKRIDCTMRFTLMGLRGSQLLSDSLTLLGFPKYLLTRTSVSG